ncbi:hypothetical protein BN946_scf184569.g41, partial [Trametes cinnabarina]
MFGTAVLGLLATSVVVCAATTARGSLATCQNFALRDISGVSLTAATYFPTNARVDISNVFSSLNASDLPAFCRVELVVVTNATAGSFANTEVWLPDAWNGRMVTIGNGGFGGGVTVSDLGGIAVPQGVSTNTGHNSSAVDGSWAGPHNDNAIVDWGWRAVHLSVLAGKAVTEQYYRQPIRRSYYIGCSTGKESLSNSSVHDACQKPSNMHQEVDRGSPANWMTHLQPWSIHMNLNVLPPTSPHFMTRDMWADVIGPEVMRQCDALDGLKDGIINDPRACSFRPETLTCRPGQNASTCLTADQISALHRIYADYYEADQTYVFGGYYPGGEDAFPGGLVGSPPLRSPRTGSGGDAEGGCSDTQWTMEDYNATDIVLGDAIDPGQSNVSPPSPSPSPLLTRHPDMTHPDMTPRAPHHPQAIDPDLLAYVAPPRNGKVLHYVGWADQLISPGNSLHYYETVHESTLANSALEIDDFYRLFLVPGMNHWLSSMQHLPMVSMLMSSPVDAHQGGQAANAFGGVSQPRPLSSDAQHNVLAAMVRWVENGIAPSTITGVKYANDNPAAGVEFTRPLCKYPSTVRYKGGNPNRASSFDCE